VGIVPTEASGPMRGAVAGPRRQEVSGRGGE
jgi:hypothetical protein